jgi:hypothetical protein
LSHRANDFVVLITTVVDGCGDDDSEARDDAGGVTAPLELTAVQLEEIPPSGDVVAELMNAASVETDPNAPLMVPAELPPSTTVEVHHYWSMDSGERTMGEGRVDWVSVTLVLIEDEADVQPLIDEVTGIDEGYVQWLPVSVRGAAGAQQAVTIPYEGEPADEPEFSTILARRDQLVVAASATGTDDDLRDAAAIGVAELVFERAGELSGD